ncbi:ATP-binding protein [Nocardia sp. NPDC057668]|uniref:ATP-binding protein n=1 Tax=Nocardia sp. NPDC057668 TaxID=3346202 RepID=UPI003670E772
MSESSNPPGGRANAVQGIGLLVGTLLACAAIAAAGVVAAVLSAPEESRVALIVGGSIAGVLLCAAVTTAVHFRSQMQRARAGEAAANAETQARLASYVASANARITEVHNHAQALEEAVTARRREVKDSENRRSAAMAAFAGAAGRMQAMSTSMLAELREMEHRHADPRVLEDLLELDHRTAQAGRLADSIAVLSGARSGRRWAKPIAMESILRGAMGRVAGYQRVRLRAVAEIAVAGHAAEGVMHVLAELLDNACNFSPPTTEVHVYAAEVPAGVVITIEDSGLVMSESALRRAELAVGGDGANPSARGAHSDLSSLSGTRLGLAVVGHLARKHDLTVSFRPSAIGGTAVVVVVPRELTTRLERPRPAATGAAEPVAAAIPVLAGGTVTSPGLPIALPRRTALPATAEPEALPAGASHDFFTLPAALTAEPAANTAAARTLSDNTTGLLGSPAALPSSAPELPGTPPAALEPPRPQPGPAADRAPAQDYWQSPLPNSTTAPNTPPSNPPAGFSGSTTPLPGRDSAGTETPPSSPASTTARLPKRQRGSALAAAHPQGLSAPAAPAFPLSSRTPSPAALGAFQRAVAGRENAGDANPPLETDR